MTLPVHDRFFIAAVGFCFGVGVASLGFGRELFLSSCLLVAAALAVACGKNTGVRRLISVAVLLSVSATISGAFFYNLSGRLAKMRTRVSFGAVAKYQGVVLSDPEQKAVQEFILKLEKPYAGKVIVRTQNYPEYQSGDRLALEGKINKPAGRYWGWKAKAEQASGIALFPKIKRIGQKERSFRRVLFGFKNRIADAFRWNLPFREASFVEGVTLGIRENITADLADAFRKSGTTHLLALSGQNITALSSILVAALVRLVRRRAATLITCAAIIGFVIMVGADSSVVRAGIMGIIASGALLLGRIRSERNAIAAAMLCMVLWRPDALVFDVGFQLSFLALIGIVYLKPIFGGGRPGQFWGLVDAAQTTLAAQIMVLPLILAAFGSAPVFGIIGNVALSSLVPHTMTAGFFLTGLDVVFRPVAELFGWVLQAVVGAELKIIEWSANAFVGLALPVSAFSAGMYYAIVVALMIYVKRKRAKSARG